MIEIKRLEIRDRATMIPALALRLTGGPMDRLLWKAGYGEHPLVMLIKLSDGQTSMYDPYSWNDRTMRTAHLYMQDNWYDHVDGGVVDVEFILHETTEQKRSELA